MKSHKALKDAPADEPVHWDSKVDKFNKRRQLVRKQFESDPKECAKWEREVRDVSLYEFWWKYNVWKGRLKRATRGVCLMVTPAYSADCANVEHACHENYARSCVVAFWRHMATRERHAMIEEAMQRDVVAVDRVFWGATKFEHPFEHVVGAVRSELDEHLGVRDLFDKFEGKRDTNWGFAMMEMLVDPVLKTWVPDWVVEQYERGNPFFRRVLRRLARQRMASNRQLLLRARKEMVRRHQAEQKRASQGKEAQQGSDDDDDDDDGEG